MKDYSIIIRPINTEKSSNQQSSGHYAFMVKRDATKIDVKNEVKRIYGVDVKEIKTMLVTRKTRIVGRGRSWDKRPVYKKAIVTIKGKKTIDPNKIKIKEIKK